VLLMSTFRGGEAIGPIPGRTANMSVSPACTDAAWKGGTTLLVESEMRQLTRRDSDKIEGNRCHFLSHTSVLSDIFSAWTDLDESA
jgi:hypothetical protein